MRSLFPSTRTFVPRVFHLFFASLLLTQSVLPGAAVQAATPQPLAADLTTTTSPADRLETTPAPEELAVGMEAQVTEAQIDAPPLTDEPFAERLPAVLPNAAERRAQPSLPAAVQLTVAEPVVVVGASVVLTVAVRSDFVEAVKDVTLTLSLPPGLRTEKGDRGELQWSLPAAPDMQPFRQQLVLAVDADAVPAAGALLTVVATLQAPGYLESSWSTTVGVAADRGRDDAVIEKRQGDQGFVLQDGTGFLTLLGAAAAVAAGTDVRYTELYRWDKETGDTETRDSGLVTTTESVTTAVGSELLAGELNAWETQLFLPYVVDDQAAVADSAGSAATTEERGNPADLPPGRDVDGVALYYQWQFEATADQERVKDFAEPLQLSLDLTPLLQAGVDPARLELWTREDAKAEWSLVRSSFDAKQGRLTAFLPHFTQFGLGAGLSQHGEILPSTIGYSVDRQTGAATLQVPIDAPSGPRGTNPNLSFSYSSMASDDLFLDSGYEYLSQTSGVGMGWSVAGSNNFVVATGNGYSLVLNGMRVNIRFEENRWRTDSETFYQVSWDRFNQTGTYPISDWGTWTVIGPDGTFYEFGDGGTFSGYSTTSPSAVFLQKSGNSTYRVVKQWYLRRAYDSLGNSINYYYKTEQATETGCVPNWPSGDRWYTSAVYPAEIHWGGNVYTGAPHRMKALFSYSTADREDYAIEGTGTSDCKQVKFAKKNRLLGVTVQVDSSGWRTYRQYDLGQSYTTTSPTAKKRLLLNSLQIRGKNNGLLRTESFTYKVGDVVATGPNRIWLESVNNGWGGKVTYHYISHRPECPTALCGQGTAQGWRAAVTRTIVEDGVDSKIFTDHWYGPPSDPNDEWGRIGYGDDGAQFFGYKESHSQFYATAPASTSNTATTPAAVIRWEKQEAWPGGESNHDPRAGKVKQVEVRTSNSGAVVAVTNYDWGTYRRSGGAWVATTKNRDTTNNSYPIIWTRLERSDTWTAGGAWSGSSFINGNGSGTQTRYSFDNTASYRGYGNITEVQEYSHAETFLAKSTWDARISGNTGLTQLRRTLTDYYPGTYVTAVPARVRIFDGGSCKSELRYIYDNVNGNYTNVPTAGILKKTEQPTNSCSGATTIGQYDGNWIITRLAHDSYGNVTALNRVGGATNGSQNIVIQTTYDNTYHRFPIEQWYSSNPAYKEYATYYGVNGLAVTDGKAFFGAMQEHCGVNEVCTRQSYDEHGRPSRTWEGVARGSAWDSDANAHLLRSYQMHGTSGLTRNVVTAWRSPRCYGNFVRKVYNGLGQLIQEQRPQQNWSTNVDGCNPGSNSAEVDVNYRYDALGRQTKVSVPVGTSASYINRAAVWSQGETETIYDVAGRPARLYAPNDERTDYGYAGRSTAVFAMGRNGDPNQVSKWTEVDGRGHLVRLRTYNKPYSEGGTVQAEISLDHDVLGNLRTVTHDNGIGTTSMSYDLASRKTGMNDPDLGTWSYAYDRQSRLTSQTDARGWTTCLYYDNIDHLTGKYFQQNSTLCPASPTYHWAFTYDGAPAPYPAARGQLTKVRYHDGSYQKVLHYNSQGLLDQTTVTMPAAGAVDANTMHYGYDSHLRPTTTTYPDGEVVTIAYNSMGLPKQLSSNIVGMVVDSAAYDAAGRLIHLRQALSNLWRNHLYAPWNQQDSKGGRLTGIWIGSSNNTTSANAYNRQKFDYNYDSFGNIKVMDEGITSFFTYDAQNRLLNATSSDYDYDYAYDSTGRLTQYENVSYPVSNSFPTHAIKKSGFAYDNNGNMIQRWVPSLGGSQTLTWNAENRLAHVGGAGIDSSYAYDADGQRVKALTATTSTYYPFANYEIAVANGVATTTKYYDFGGLRVAMRENNNPLKYLYQNHLGSVIYVTHDGGTPITEQRYFPYGRKRSGGSLPTDHRFTGQKYSDANGLYYYNARYYDPELGTFISPDTIVPDPALVSDYNRYLYVRGNPLKYSDPTGHYSNNEIMQHFGCEHWECVEEHFQDGGSHAGMWGWLYMLQEAEDGDSVTSTAVGISHNSQMTGAFQRGGDGKIYVNGQSLITYSDTTVSASINAMISELGFAAFAGNGDVGFYALNGKTHTVNREYKHNYLYIDPVEVLKTGTDIGPMIVAGAPMTGPAAPVVATAGKAYTAVGYGATVADDFVAPLVQGDWNSLGTNAAQEVASFGAQQYLGPAGPWVSGGISAYGFSQGICYGTGCPR